MFISISQNHLHDCWPQNQREIQLVLIFIQSFCCFLRIWSNDETQHLAASTDGGRPQVIGSNTRNELSYSRLITDKWTEHSDDASWEMRFGFFPNYTFNILLIEITSIVKKLRKQERKHLKSFGEALFDEMAKHSHRLARIIHGHAAA